jgi:hypothetical protein
MMANNECYIRKLDNNNNNNNSNNNKTSGVSHCGLTIYIKKYLKAKKKNSGNSNIEPCKNIIFNKIL